MVVFSGCSSLKVTEDTPYNLKHLQRNGEPTPPRAGEYVLNRSLEMQKSISQFPSGWQRIGPSGVVGQYNKDWAVVLDYKRGFEDQTWIKTGSHLAVQPLVDEKHNQLIIALVDGRILKASASSGDLLWVKKLDARADRPILVSHDKVIVVTARQSIYTINADSGKIQSQISSETVQSVVPHQVAPAIINNDKLFVGLASGEIKAIDLTSGSLLYAHKNTLVGPNRKLKYIIAITIKDHSLHYVRSDGYAGQLPTEDVRPWKESASPNETLLDLGNEFGRITAATYSKESLFLGSATGMIIAVDYQNQFKKEWDPNQLASTIRSIIATDRRKIFALTEDGDVACLNLEGKQLWRESLEKPINPIPIYLGSDLIFFSSGAMLHSFHL